MLLPVRQALLSIRAPSAQEASMCLSCPEQPHLGPPLQNHRFNFRSRPQTLSKLCSRHPCLLQSWREFMAVLLPPPGEGYSCAGLTGTPGHSLCPAECPYREWWEASKKSEGQQSLSIRLLCARHFLGTAICLAQSLLPYKAIV